MPASLEDETNPDWLPSLNLGHDKVSNLAVEKAEDRWKRRKAREDSTVRSVAEPVRVSASPSASLDDENSGKLYDSGTQTDLTSSMIDHLREELNQSSVKVC